MAISYHTDSLIPTLCYWCWKLLIKACALISRERSWREMMNKRRQKRSCLLSYRRCHISGGKLSLVCRRLVHNLVLDTASHIE